MKAGKQFEDYHIVSAEPRAYFKSQLVERFQNGASKTDTFNNRVQTSEIDRHSKIRVRSNHVFCAQNEM